MNNESPIFRSLAMIEERIQEKLTVESLADSVHFSKYHYQRMFREAVGDSVMRYVTRRKLCLAAEELARKDANVLEIALKYGYDSHEGFTRSFRAHTGVTPTEYRKYHQFIWIPSARPFGEQSIANSNRKSSSCDRKEMFRLSPMRRKEGENMMYIQNTDEMIRELNSLIVQTKETAAYTRKCKEALTDAAFYVKFWEFTADRTEELAKRLTQILGGITAITERPDEISARFVIVKAVEDAVFWSDITAFQTGLTVSRADPECQEVFQPVCLAYKKLAQDAHLRAERIVGSFRELADPIFRDMRKNVEQKIKETVETGRKAAKGVSEQIRPSYAYIVEEIRVVTEEIASIPLEEMTIRLLEDEMFRLDIIFCAADVDILQTPARKPLLDSIMELRGQMEETIEFLQSLPEDAGHALVSAEKSPVPDRTERKKYEDVAFQGKVLLFYLKGELQKLSPLNLEALGAEERGAALEAGMEKAIRLAQLGAERAEVSEIRESFQRVYHDMTEAAVRLGDQGAPLQYIAEEIGRLLIRL